MSNIRDMHSLYSLYVHHQRKRLAQRYHYQWQNALRGYRVVELVFSWCLSQSIEAEAILMAEVKVVVEIEIENF